MDIVVVNVDATLVAEAPKIAPYLQGMKANLADALAVAPNRVGIKRPRTKGWAFLARRGNCRAGSGFCGKEMSLRFFNTLTREIEEFQPIEPNRVRMYTCGPTVHDYAYWEFSRLHL